MTLIDHPTRHLRPVEPATPDTVVVRAWWDPELATTGFAPRSSYAERYWLGVIGPSTLLLLRRFARGLEEHPGGFRADLADTAMALGLGAGTGRQSQIVRTIDRACMFGTMRRAAPGELEVRTHLPRLTRRQLERLPEVVRRSHDSWLAHPANAVQALPEPPDAA